MAIARAFGARVTDWIDEPRADHGIRFYQGEGTWQRFGYPELADLVRGAAARFQEAGVAPGEVVPVVLPTGPELVAAFYGLLLSGAVPSVLPLPWALSGHAPYAPYLTDLAAYRTPRFVAASEEYAPEVMAGARAAGLDVVNLAPGARTAQRVRRMAPQGPAVLQFTSGSRGRPRAVAVGPEALRTHVRMLGSVLPDTGWGGVSWLPMYHDMGLVGNLLVPVTAQWEHALMRPESFVMEPAAWLGEYGRNPYPIMTMPNFGFARVCSNVRPDSLAGLDFSRVRAVLTGAERVDPAVLARFSRFLEPYGFDHTTVLPCYGMAETTLAVTAGPAAGLRPVMAKVPAGAKAVGQPVRVGAEHPLGLDEPVNPWLWYASCGRPLEGIEVRVTDRDGHELPEGALGEIRVASPSLGQGYTVPEAAGSTRWADGVLHTGDAGFVRGGELYVVGRLGDALDLEHGSVFMEELEAQLAGRIGVRPHRLMATGGADPGPTLLVLTTFDPVPHLPVIEAVAESFTHGRAALKVVRVGRPDMPVTTSGKPRRSTAWIRHLKGEFGKAEVFSPGERTATVPHRRNPGA